MCSIIFIIFLCGECIAVHYLALLIVVEEVNSHSYWCTVVDIDVDAIVKR